MVFVFNFDIIYKLNTVFPKPQGTDIIPPPLPYASSINFFTTGFWLSLNSLLNFILELNINNLI